MVKAFVLFASVGTCMTGNRVTGNDGDVKSRRQGVLGGCNGKVLGFMSHMTLYASVRSVTSIKIRLTCM